MRHSQAHWLYWKIKYRENGCFKWKTTNKSECLVNCNENKVFCYSQSKTHKSSLSMSRLTLCLITYSHKSFNKLIFTWNFVLLDCILYWVCERYFLCWFWKENIKVEVALKIYGRNTAGFLFNHGWPERKEI